MFYCHSDNRRTISLASLSGWARIAGVSPDGPGPILPHWRIGTPSLAGSTSNPHVAPTPSEPMTFQTPAALVFDFDDLAHGLPVAERIMATAATETGADRDAVCIT
jgi:hypothetical protein